MVKTIVTQSGLRRTPLLTPRCSLGTLFFAQGRGKARCHALAKADGFGVLIGVRSGSTKDSFLEKKRTTNPILIRSQHLYYKKSLGLGPSSAFPPQSLHRCDSRLQSWSVEDSGFKGPATTQEVLHVGALTKNQCDLGLQLNEQAYMELQEPSCSSLLGSCASYLELKQELSSVSSRFANRARWRHVGAEVLCTSDIWRFLHLGLVMGPS